MPPLRTRLKNVARGWLRCSDIVLCYLWLAPLHVFGLADAATGRQVVSAYAGKGAHHGRPWAIRLARVIDWLAVKVGDGPDHCRRAYLFYLCVDVEDY